MTAARAQQIASMCAPGIEWASVLVNLNPPVIRLMGTTPNGDQLSFYHQPLTATATVKLHECLHVSREVLGVTEAWAGGEL